MSYSRQELEEAGLLDFRVFLAEVWMYLQLPSPTPVQYDIAHALQVAYESDNHEDWRLCVQAFRGVGKSYITVAFVLWVLLLDPQKKILVVSASQPLADGFSTFAMKLIRGMEILQILAPRPGQKESNVAFDVGPSRDALHPSVRSAGITGQITGGRADVIVFDDVEVPKNSQTHGLRDRLAELVKEGAAVLKPGGFILYLGTPQVEASLYERLPERGYTIKIWPAEIPENPDIYRGRLADYVVRLMASGAKAHTPVDPLRFDETELGGKRIEYGAAGYALQFMLDTSPSSAEKYPLKCKDLLLTDVDDEKGHVGLMWSSDPQHTIQDLGCGGLQGDHYVRPSWKSEEATKWTGTVMAIDPSGTGTDETAYAIVRFLHGKLYLVSVGGFKEGYSEATLMALAALAARYRVNSVIAETNFGSGMFNQLLKPHLARLKTGGFDEDYDGWSSGQKEIRVLNTLEPLIQSHKLVVDRRVIQADEVIQQDKPAYSFIYQLTRISRQRGALAHDDRLEAVSMACAYYLDRMDRDDKKSLDNHKAALKQEEMKNFHKHVMGYAPQQQTYQQSSRRTLN